MHQSLFRAMREAEEIGYLAGSRDRGYYGYDYEDGYDDYGYDFEGAGNAASEVAHIALNKLKGTDNLIAGGRLNLANKFTNSGVAADFGNIASDSGLGKVLAKSELSGFYKDSNLSLKNLKAALKSKEVSESVKKQLVKELAKEIKEVYKGLNKADKIRVIVMLNKYSADLAKAVGGKMAANPKTLEAALKNAENVTAATGAGFGRLGTVLLTILGVVGVAGVGYAGYRAFRS